ncbi:aminoglycoside phosphotransferase family protein [Streptomyces sp. ME01-24h]|nr:aminoglycoside phosphotransferase family protein [Streptomyces sp. ME01-24h]
MATAAPASDLNDAFAVPRHIERSRLREPLVRWHYNRRRRDGESVVLTGHHNRNEVVTLDRRLARLARVALDEAARIKLRVPLTTPKVVMRTWSDEADVLAALNRAVAREAHRPPPFGVPQCLVTFGQAASLHRFVPGRPLSQEAPPGTPVGERRLRDIAKVFAYAATVDREQLPKLPRHWPADKDSDGFLAYLVDCAQRVYLEHRPGYGILFDALRVPVDALERFRRRVRDQVGELRPRPFALLHTDLHRDNIVLQKRGNLFILDWELATYGDPLHDLATHLVRMEYTDRERERMKKWWKQTLDQQDRALTDGMDTDLPVYMDFEYAQSVYADVVRAAVGLGAEPGRPTLERSVTMVLRALERARVPFGLASVPGEGEVEAALAEWHARRYPERRLRTWSFTDRLPRGGAGAR